MPRKYTLACGNSTAYRSNELPVTVTVVPAFPDDGDTIRLGAAIARETRSPARSIPIHIPRRRDRLEFPDLRCGMRSGMCSGSLVDLPAHPTQTSRGRSRKPILQSCREIRIPGRHIPPSGIFPQQPSDFAVVTIKRYGARSWTPFSGGQLGDPGDKTVDTDKEFLDRRDIPFRTPGRGEFWHSRCGVIPVV